MKRLYAFCVITFLLSPYLLAQTGEIQGRVYDVDKKDGIPFATVVLESNGVQRGFGTTDDNGNFGIKPIVPGTYSLKCAYLGYQPKVVENVIVSSDKITFQDIPLKASSSTLPEVVVSSQKLIEPDKTTTGTTVTKEDIANIATRNTNNYAAISAGVYQRDDNAALNIGGSRDYSNKYYVDGIPMRGSVNLPQSSIEQLTVITGGLPARYGDATGGVINITTRGPSEEYHGGVELVTSQFLDGYGYDLASFNVSGPLWTQFRHTDSANARLGFFLSGEYEHNDDGSPSAVQLYKVDDNTLNKLRTNPLTPSPTSSAGFVPSAEYVTDSDLVKISARQNDGSNSYRLAGKFDFQVNKYVNLTLGGNFDMDRYALYSWTRSLFNYDGNGYEKDNVYRGFFRFTQRFPSNLNTEKKTGAIFENAYYSIQADYTKNYNTFGDKNLWTNAFDYGYVGKFDVLNEPVYGFGKDTATNKTGWLLLGYGDTLVNFAPASTNPYTTAYTTEYYNYFQGQPDGHYRNLGDLVNGGALINGQIPPTVYSLYTGTGYPYGTYGVVNDDQLRLSLNASVDVVNASKGEKSKHGLEFGFEYEQRINRQWQVFPYADYLGGLWGLARLLVNSQLSFDYAHPVEVTDENGVFLDTIKYNYISNPNNQTYFDKQLRTRLGLDPNGTEVINVDTISPGKLSLDLFSADELLNQGKSFVSYYGYDYLGNRLKKQPSLDDFFNQKDANGNYMRNIGAFNPNYSAVYVQDKFNFKDLIFNIGLRVDRYDASTKVLADKYSLYPIRTAAEVTQFGPHPSTIGGDYKVYVDNIVNPTKIMGYRNGDTWYDASGNVISNPASITGPKGIQPYLVDNVDSPELGPSSFTDYTPQFTVMPRIAFSFPISDEALFFAHYDVLSQRPNAGEALAIVTDYFFLQNNTSSSTLNNPALGPERTVDYQVGFKQALGLSSALTIAATYRELKDLIQEEKVLYAYPFDYTTFGNSDFGTVKQFEFTYELRRFKNIQLDANYTLQFASGTGSSPFSSANLINSDQPNLKPIFPFDYDQRHTINIAVDYRFGEGRNYNGPVVGAHNTPILANTGLNVIFRAGSGTPFTRQTNATPDAEFGVATQTSILGTVNGSRLPWTFKIDAKLDKDFKLGNGSRTPYYLNVYILVQNLLDAANVLSVYRYTGNPNDDGWITSALGQQNLQSGGIVSDQSYINLYGTKVNDPSNYSLARRIHLGLIFNF